MDLQTLLPMVARTFINNAGSSANGLSIDSVIPALMGLLGGKDGQIDIAGLVSQLGSSGLMDMAASWLGDGQNQSISTESILSLFGQSQLEGFAEKLGLTTPDAIGGLQGALPELVDKASQGGELMEGMGSALLGNAMKGFFGS